MRIKLFLVFLACLSFTFLPTAIFIIFSMIPTLAIFAIDRSVGHNQTICIGAMNFAGCFPFLLDFWTQDIELTVRGAFSLAANPDTFVFIGMMALGGYAIDWAVTRMTGSIILEKSKRRLNKIDKEQTKLVNRWGEKVTGRYQLDDYGFPVRPIPKAEPEEKKDSGANNSKDDSKPQSESS